MRGEDLAISVTNTDSEANVPCAIDAHKLAKDRINEDHRGDLTLSELYLPVRRRTG